MKKEFKKWKVQDYKKVKMVKKMDNGIVSYSSATHNELTKIRNRLQEIYQITIPLRKETYNLRKQHEVIIENISGVKIGN